MAFAVSTFPRILACGDSALVVEFGDTIDAAINSRVLGLDRAVAKAAIAGVIETVPTYRSLLVHYDPLTVEFAALRDRMMALARSPPPPTEAGRGWRIPVVYGGDYGIDLETVAQFHSVSTAEIIARHSGAQYRVAMLGFTPGFAYLSGLDPDLATPRRESPRTVTPAGTISIGGVQAAVQCLAGPSGWHLLGRTPVRTYHPGRNPTFLIEPGDTVTFHAIDAREWPSLAKRADAGEPVAEVLSA